MMPFSGPPEWFWKLLFILAGVGALTGVAGFIWLIVWLCKHLKIV